MEEQPKQSIAVPIAIVIAGAMIAAAVYFIYASPSTPSEDFNLRTEDVKVKPVTADDHIIGNPTAKIVIIEYSDTECPYCKDFHVTMHRIVDEYGADGRVAWVYRHLPIAELHSKAPKEAEAAECVASLGGNTAFWEFLDKVYEITPSNNGLDHSLLPGIAVEAGVDRAKFEQCLSSGQFTARITQAVDDGFAAGAQGTPHSVFVVKGQYIPVEGAQPYGAMRSNVEAILAQLAGQSVVPVTGQ